MKNKIIISFAIILGILSSCTDDLEQLPITQLESTNFYSNEKEIELATMGIYASLQSNGLYGLDIIGVGEVSSDNTFEQVPANDGGRFGQLDDFSTIPNNDLVGSVWRASYVAIQRANVVLNRINDVPYTSNTTKNTRIAEVKFIRALLYFNLVRLYGDVPLVIEETINPNTFFGQGRTSSTQVYNKIISDLISAISQLPATNTQGRVNLYAAKSLLGKIYLTQKNFPLALTQFQDVVNSNVYQLLPITNIFGTAEESGNKEAIFSVQFASNVNGNTEGSRAFSQFAPSGVTSNAKGHNLPTKTLYDIYSTNDLRKTAYLAITSGNIPYVKKFTFNTTNANDGGSDFMVLRYSDIVLNYAETLNETGNISQAADWLNKIRKRADLANTEAVTQTDLRSAIDLERRLELVGEGHRWFDLLRTDQAISVMNQYFSNNNINITITSKNLLLPIPQSQIDTDPAIKQNIGY